MRLLIVGGGRMGEALLGGLLNAGWTDLGVVENGVVRLLDAGVQLPEQSRVIVVASDPG